MVRRVVPKKLFRKTKGAAKVNNPNARKTSDSVKRCSRASASSRESRTSRRHNGCWFWEIKMNGGNVNGKQQE